MSLENSLDLLSNEAKEIGFENMKSTLEKIIKVDLGLSKEMETEISNILVSLSTIINKNIHSKKIRLDIKIKSDSEIIKCGDVSLILDKSNDLLKELLGSDNKEEISAELELAIEEVGEKKILAGKSEKDRESYLESIRYKNELKKKLEEVILLEEIINEINSYRDKLISLVEGEDTNVVSDELLINPEIEDSLGLDTNVESERGLEEEMVVEVKQEEDVISAENNKLELFDFEVLKLIKLNLKNKKTELPKQNSLYSEVKEYFSDEARLTFYHLGLYKLVSGFSDNKILDSYNAKNIIGLLDVNVLCNFFIEGRLGQSDEILLSVLGSIFKNAIRLREEYYGLGKSLYYYLLKKSGREHIYILNNRYHKFLNIIEKEDIDINEIDLNTISFLDVSESEEVRKKLYDEYKEETYNVKRSKVGIVRKVRRKDRAYITQDLIEKKRKLTKAYNIDKYKKIFGSVNAEKFKDFFEIDKELFLKVGSIEVVELYLSSLDRLKNDFDEDYYEKTKGILKDFIVFIKNGVKSIPSVCKSSIETDKKNKLVFRKNIEFHLGNFGKTASLNTFFRDYLNQNLSNIDFLNILVEILSDFEIDFTKNFLTVLGEEYDISEVKLLLEKKDINIKVKSKVKKTIIEKKIDIINNFQSEEELIKFYKKEAPNFAVKKEVEYFVAFLDKFIEFSFKGRYLYTVKSRILRLKEDYEFSEEQNIFFNELEEEQNRKEKEEKEKKEERERKKAVTKLENNKEKDRQEKELEIKRKVRNFAKEGKYIELREYVNKLDNNYEIGVIFFLKKMTEALLNSDNTLEVKNILYGND